MARIRESPTSNAPEPLHERMKPEGNRALNPNRHRPGQRGVELFDRAALVSQLTLAHLPGACVQHGHLLFRV
jgi:hypothetical protein